MTIAPLSHLRVLDMTRLYPGAMCTVLLADMGADVVKLEPPGRGDGMRDAAMGGFPAGHVALNRGKRSVAFDTRADGAAEALARLVRGFDVVVESARPGALEALGMGHEQLAEGHPGLVWCSISGFGPDGPNAAQPGHDLTYLGASGLLSQLEVGGDFPIADVVLTIPLAALTAVSGILAAVVECGRTGVGRRIDVDMVDAAMWVMAEPITRAASAPGPGWPPLAARAVYRCEDDRPVTVAATEPRTWSRLCAALGLPELADRPIGVDEDDTRARLRDRFRTRPAADWLAEPGLGGGVGPVHTADDLASGARPSGTELVTLDDGTPAPSSPIRFDLAPAAATTATAAPPALGEHTETVLTGAGFTDAEIAELRAGGVI